MEYYVGKFNRRHKLCVTPIVSVGGSRMNLEADG